MLPSVLPRAPVLSRATLDQLRAIFGPRALLHEPGQLQTYECDGLTSFRQVPAHHAPSPALLDQCVHCGFCLPACPTYALGGEEMDSPRGRLWMMRKVTRGEAALVRTFQLHMDRCLGCMACVPQRRRVWRAD